MSTTSETAGATALGLAGRRILVVDDDGEMLDAFEDVLRDAGHDVVCFPDGDKALRYLRAARRPHVVLLDLTMPVMNGREFIREFTRRADLAAIPVLMITGATTLDDLPIPPERVLRKPVHITTLLEAIDQVTATPPPR